MNLRNVLGAYSKLRQLTDDESALLETLRGLNDAERESLVVALQPEKVTGKRASKKSSKPASKSVRAPSLQQQLKGTASRTITGPACSVCGNVEDHPDHDTAHYLSAHEFDAGKSSAQPARGKSSTNGGAGNSTVNSEAEKENASTATGG